MNPSMHRSIANTAIEPSSSQGATLDPTYAETPMPKQDVPAESGLYGVKGDGIGGGTESSYDEIQGFAPSEGQKGTLEHAAVAGLYDVVDDGLGGGAESSCNAIPGYMDMPVAPTAQQGDDYLQMGGGSTKIEDDEDEDDFDV